MDKTSYRADIDGLRAIAVLSVVIYHINSSFLPGGFIGVDIFFVISGFLITSQIYNELQGGIFSIRNFYKRRINRILPALLLVIFISLLVGIFLLSPLDLITLFLSAFYSVIGVSNVFFWREYGNYFAGNASDAILLHTWTLGVEEQFYVVWPWFVMFLMKLSNRHVAVISLICCVIFLAISEIGANNFTSASYYLIPSRCFELAIGATLACSRSRIKSADGVSNTFASVLGFSLIAFSLIYLDNETVFPGVNALYPCLGTAILIWCGYNRNALSVKVLSYKYLVFVGLISYSLYLWHWPVIAYLNYLDINVGSIAGLGILSFSVCAAWLSWKYVEVPFRKSGSPRQLGSIVIKRFAIPAAGLAVLSAASAHFSGFPDRYSSEVLSLEKVAWTKPDVLRANCHVPTALYRTEPNRHCRLGVNKDSSDGILIGDSYANHFSGMVDVIAKSDGITITDYTMNGCPPIWDYEAHKLAAYAAKCKARNKYSYNHIGKVKYKVVILSANWPPPQEVGELVKRSVGLIVNSGAKVIIILENAPIERAESCPIRKLMYGLSKECDVRETNHAEYWKDVKNTYPHVLFVDPNDVICKNGVCSPVVDRTLLYRDSGHLNDIGSRLVGKLLISRGVSFLK